MIQMEKTTKVYLQPFDDAVLFETLTPFSVVVKKKGLKLCQKVTRFCNFCLGWSYYILKVLGVCAIYDKINDKLAPHWKIRWSMFGIVQLAYIYRAFYVHKSFVTFDGYGMVSCVILLYHAEDLYYLLTPIDEKKYFLPTTSLDDEKLNIFEPMLTEYEGWKQMIVRTIVGLVTTYYPSFKIPFYWPVLMVYVSISFLVITVLFAKRIRSMIRLGYVPYTVKPKKKTIVTKVKPLPVNKYVKSSRFSRRAHLS